MMRLQVTLLPLSYYLQYRTSMYVCTLCPSSLIPREYDMDDT